jgi:hypothetical protein
MKAMALSIKIPEGSPEGVRRTSPPGTVSGSDPTFDNILLDTQSACTSTESIDA